MIRRLACLLLGHRFPREILVDEHGETLGKWINREEAERIDPEGAAVFFPHCLRCGAPYP